jgi:nitroreductase
MLKTESIRKLRAVRQFSNRDIPDDVLQDILEVGRWTGSSENSQPWDLIVVRDRETLKALASYGKYAGHVAGAKVGIALVMHADDVWTNMDEGRLMQNLMLAAWAHDIGSCIGSVYPEDNEERARKRLGIPKDRFIRTVLSLGYPADSATVPVRRPSKVPRGRRPLADLVSWEKFGNKSV